MMCTTVSRSRGDAVGINRHSIRRILIHNSTFTLGGTCSDSHIHAISVFRAGLFKTYSMDLCIACAYCDTVVSANKIID